MNRRPITDEALRRALALRDLTEAALGPHAMQTLVAEVVAALRDAWSCDVVVARGSPVVAVADNYERLGYAADATGRDARYSRYLDDERMLRAHTTAQLPPLLRDVARAGWDDVLLICAGLTYRRDAIDRLHVGEPHQLDLWRIGSVTRTAADLRELVALVVDALLPGAAHRARPAQHPYTRDGLEVEVRVGDAWVELLECGLAAPAVLAGAGLPPARRHGLALGIGLDRALMLRKGVDDIRLLRSTDARIARQMLDLEPYRPVSAQPPARRDLSIATAPGTDAEELGDRVRAALGDDAGAVEEVAILSETPAAALAPAAAARLGIATEQANVLVRVVLRHPTRTLGAAEANALRDRIYAAIHEGAVATWAGTGPPGPG